MRKVFIHMEDPGDFSWNALNVEYRPFEWTLTNLNESDVDFIRPSLKRSIVNGVYIHDYCVGLDRRFSKETNSLLNMFPNNRGVWV